MNFLNHFIGDINFAPIISDAKIRKGAYIILLHSRARTALLSCANETVDFHQFAEDLSFRVPDFSLKGNIILSKTINIILILLQILFYM